MLLIVSGWSAPSWARVTLSRPSSNSAISLANWACALVREREVVDGVERLGFVASEGGRPSRDCLVEERDELCPCCPGTTRRARSVFMAVSVIRSSAPSFRLPRASVSSRNAQWPCSLWPTSWKPPRPGRWCNRVYPDGPDRARR